MQRIGRDSSDPSVRERLFREARAAASLSHPNICQLFDIGEEEGTPFLVMELLEGKSLVGCYYMARGLSRCGHQEQALQLLDAAESKGFFCYPFFVRDAWLDPLRGDARFLDVLRRAEGRWRDAKRAFDAHPGSRVLSVG